MVYSKDIIYTTGGSVIALRHIEEISFPADPLDNVVDILKDDLHMVVFTVSGRVHNISMNATKAHVGYKYDVNNTELRMAIYERWLFIIKG